MSNEETSREVAPDPELRAALRLVESEPPLEEVDWDALGSSIRARAELPLARRRAEAEGARARSGAARAWRPLIPLAAAASIALAVWLGGGEDSPESAPVEPVSAEEAFRPDLTEQEFRLLVTGRSDPEGMLRLALDEG